MNTYTNPWGLVTHLGDPHWFLSSGQEFGFAPALDKGLGNALSQVPPMGIVKEVCVSVFLYGYLLVHLDFIPCIMHTVHV